MILIYQPRSNILNQNCFYFVRKYSAFMLVLFLTHAFVLIYLPLRTLGASILFVINFPVTYVGYGLMAAMFGLLLVNLGVPTPGFGLYYAVLLVGLILVFLAFSDVVVTGDDDAS